MAQSGWYDDPDGTVGRLRYWDGTQWTPDTMPRPVAPAPGPDSTAVLPPVVSPDATAVLPPVAGPNATAVLPPVVGPQPGATGSYAAQNAFPGQGGYPPGQAPYPPAPVPPAGKPRRGISPLVAVLALALLVGIGVGVNALLRPSVTPTRQPTAQASMPTTFPSVSLPPVTVPGQTVVPTIPDPSGGPSLPVPADCPSTPAGTLSDGTISATMPATWETYVPGVGWATCSVASGREVVAKWMTSAIVATAPADGKSAQAIAQAAWDWNVQTNYEQSGSPVNVTSNKITTKQAVSVAGKQGYQVSGTVSISGLSGVPGDDVTILVVDNADGSHSLLFTMSTIGDATSKAEVASIWASVKVA